MKTITKVIILILISSLTVLQLPAQAFDLDKFSNPKKYGWESFEQRTEFRNDHIERQQLLQLYEVKVRSIPGTMAKSAIFPGWGHYTIESYNKGHAFLSGSVVVLGAGLYFYSRSQDYYKQYKNATQIDIINSNYDKAEQNHTTSLIFAATYAILWGFCLFDTAESTENYNANLWDNIVNKRFENISLSPNGIEVRF
ncbi:MAG: hypothetical protein WC155_07775 [Candidatus Cloacimonadales bacterium]